MSDLTLRRGTGNVRYKTLKILAEDGAKCRNLLDFHNLRPKSTPT